MELRELKAHLDRLYGRRNNIFLPGRRNRIDFLNIAIGDLQEAVRKFNGKDIVAQELARVMARTFALGECFKSMPMIEMLAIKYPSKACAYCGQLPCDCPERRNSAKLAESADPDQLKWRLTDWCKYLDILYGHRNRLRSPDYIVNRLFKEISELLSLEMRLPSWDASFEEIEREFALELADALAWEIALANVLNIDLEATVLERYGQGCRKCHQPTECRCRHRDFLPKKYR